MSQIQDRLVPWAPTMLATGLLATLAESVAERDVTSICLILMALLGFGLLVRTKRGLSRDEVRAEIMVGVRAMVHPNALQPRDPVDAPSTIRSSGSTLQRSQAEAPTDPRIR